MRDQQVGLTKTMR